MKRGRKCGWAHADDESMLAVICEVVAWRNALNPEVVYEWAVQHGHDYEHMRDHVAKREVADWELGESVRGGKGMEPT